MAENVVYIYRCPKCERRLDLGWLPPASGVKACRCGATVRLGRAAFLQAWRNWFSVGGMSLGLVVLLTLLGQIGDIVDHKWLGYVLVTFVAGAMLVAFLGGLFALSGHVIGCVVAWARGVEETPYQSLESTRRMDVAQLMREVQSMTPEERRRLFEGGAPEGPRPGPPDGSRPRPG